jgi:hypothetical protein
LPLAYGSAVVTKSWREAVWFAVMGLNGILLGLILYFMGCRYTSSNNHA